MMQPFNIRYYSRLNIGVQLHATHLFAHRSIIHGTKETGSKRLYLLVWLYMTNNVCVSSSTEAVVFFSTSTNKYSDRRHRRDE